MNRRIQHSQQDGVLGVVQHEKLCQGFKPQLVKNLPPCPRNGRQAFAVFRVQALGLSCTEKVLLPQKVVPIGAQKGPTSYGFALSHARRVLQMDPLGDCGFLLENAAHKP